MILELELHPVTVHERTATVVWDSEAGSFSGPEAETLDQLCRTYARLGTVVTHPYPTTYPCDDPFHDPAHLAAVISTRWQLPEELAAHLKVTSHPPGDAPVVY